MPHTVEEMATELAQEEYRQATRALAVEMPERARRTSQRRLDATLVAHSRSGPAMACRDGCDMCCYLRVVATAPEVFALVDFLRSTLSQTQITEFEQRVQSTADRVAAMSVHEHMHTNVPCPVLSDGRCLGYAARPMMCRSYHSTERDACENAYNHPFDMEPRRGVLPEREVASGAHQHAWRTALSHHGYDAGQYELIKVLAEAVANDEAHHRFLARRLPTFTFAADDAPEQPNALPSASARPGLPDGHMSLAD